MLGLLKLTVIISDIAAAWHLHPVTAAYKMDEVYNCELLCPWAKMRPGAGVPHSTMSFGSVTKVQLQKQSDMKRLRKHRG